MLESIESSDGALCVDFFQRPDNDYGFESFRSAPEDGGRWTAIGGTATRRFGSPLEAASAATEAVVWLADDGRAMSALQAWRAFLNSEHQAP